MWGSLPGSCALRQLGLGGSGQAARRLQLAAEDNLVAKRHLTERHCEVPDEPRSTFLMVFSPDGTKVASTHGNHNVYVSELSSGKHVKTLSGHPRTPWCVAFHPSHTQLLASGCLGGQVRVWDLSGGSEVWTVGTETVIASIAFHPRDQLLVIATFNELHFWDWSIPAPLISVKTNSIKSKVRFVAFDALGHKLITGISCWNYPTTSNSIVQPVPYLPPENSYSRLSPGNSSHEQIVSSYHHLVQRYDSLVRNYHHLIMGGSQQANTTDRGTDPMEVDWSSNINTSPRPQATNLTGNTNANTNNDDSTNSNIPMERSASRNISSHQSNIIRPPSTSILSSIIAESSLQDPRPSTSQSAFQPVTSSANASNGNSQVTPPSNTSTSRDNSTNSTVPNQAMRNELTASLNRLQGFMENSIDQTLNLWERYDAARSSSMRLMNLLRDFPAPRSGNRNNANPPVNSQPLIAESDPPVNPIPPIPYPNEYYPPIFDRAGFVEISPEDYSQNSESSNDNIDDQRFDAINDVLRESGSRLLNLLTGMRSSRGERYARVVSRFENNTGPFNSHIPMDTHHGHIPWVAPGMEPVEILENPDINNLTDSNNSNQNTSNTPSSPSTGLLQLLLNRDDYSDESPQPTNETQQSNQETSNSRFSQEVPSDATRSNDAFDRVTRGVQAIERHTDALISLWNSGQTSLRRVRGMWEDLRREIISLQRSSDHESPGCFSLPPLDRCRLLNNCIPYRPRPSGGTRGANTNLTGRSNMPTGNTSNSSSGPRIIPRPRNNRTSSNLRLLSLNSRVRSNLNEKLSQRLRHRLEMSNHLRNININQDTPPPFPHHSSHPTLQSSNVRERTSGQDPPTPSTSSTTNASNTNVFRGRSFLSLMRRHRCRQVASRSRIIRLQEIGHRRNVMNIRRGELDVTRDRIRMRARRVLAIMFSIMMDCLEADQLSNRIITMLRLLKKALSVTCLLLVAHLFHEEPPRPQTNQPQNSTSHSENNASQEGQPVPPTPPPESNPPVQPSESEAAPSNNQNPIPPEESLASRIQEHRNDIYVQIRRSRTLLRLGQLARVRRRVELNSRNADAPLSSPMQNISSNNDAVPPTDNTAPDTSTAPNAVSSSTAEQPTNNSNPPSDGSPRSRQIPYMRRIPPRPLFSRPSCIYRRFLFNHRLMGNMLQVLRHPDSPESNREYGTPPGYLSRMLMESMRRRENTNRDQNPNASQNLSVPLVHVNDVPINDVGPNAENPQRSQPPPYSRADYLHPMLAAQNAFPNDENESRWSTTIRFTTECPSSSVHRIQVWDFTQGQLPDISNVNKNIVVRKCKIHNDASIDISRDGRLLVALLPAQRMGNITHLLGIFSLEWNNLGECLYTTLLEQNAVSVSLSPCARHLAVGLGSRRVSLLPYVRNGVMAVIFRLGSVKMKENDTRLGSLIPIRSLEQSLDSGFTSLNCLRWAPQPGQGLVYANNKGQLKILS